MSLVAAENGQQQTQQVFMQLKACTLSGTQPNEENGGATPTLDKIVRAHNTFVAGQRSLFMAIHPEASFQNYLVDMGKDIAIVYPLHNLLFRCLFPDWTKPCKWLPAQSL
jgi:hypothetical protein